MVVSLILFWPAIKPALAEETDQFAKLPVGEKPRPVFMTAPLTSSFKGRFADPPLAKRNCMEYVPALAAFTVHSI